MRVCLVDTSDFDLLVCRQTQRQHIHPSFSDHGGKQVDSCLLASSAQWRAPCSRKADKLKPVVRGIYTGYGLHTSSRCKRALSEGGNEENMHQLPRKQTSPHPIATRVRARRRWVKYKYAYCSSGGTKTRANKMPPRFSSRHAPHYQRSQWR